MASLRFYQRRIDHNSHHDRNVLRTKGGRRKTTKSICGCHGYHETCWWNSGWCPCQGLCILQKTDQRVIQQKNYGSLKGNNITLQHGPRRKLLCCFAGPWTQANPPCPWGTALMSFFRHTPH